MSIIKINACQQQEKINKFNDPNLNPRTVLDYVMNYFSLTMINKDILIAIAMNPNTPTKVIHDIVGLDHKENEDVIKALATNKNLDTQTLFCLIKSPNFYVRAEIASNPLFPQELKSKMALECSFSKTFSTYHFIYRNVLEKFKPNTEESQLSVNSK